MIPTKCPRCEELQANGNVRGLREHYAEKHTELLIDESLRVDVIKELLNSGYNGIQAHEMTNTQQKLTEQARKVGY